MCPSARSSSSGPRLLPSCPLAAPPRLGGGGTIGDAPGFFPRRSPLPALRASPRRPRFLCPAGGAGGRGRLRHLREAQGPGGLGAQARSWGAHDAHGQVDARGPQGPAPPAGWSRRVDGRAGFGLGLRPPARRSLAGLGEEGRVRDAGGCSHFTPGSHDRGGGAGSHPRGEKEAGSRGVKPLSSCCQLISEDQGRTNVCFPASSACTVLCRYVFSWPRRTGRRRKAPAALPHCLSNLPQHSFSSSASLY